LPQVIAGVTDRQPAGSPQRLGGVRSKGRYLHVRWAVHGKRHDDRVTTCAMLASEKAAGLSASRLRRIIWLWISSWLATAGLQLSRSSSFESALTVGRVGQQILRSSLMMTAVGSRVFEVRGQRAVVLHAWRLSWSGLAGIRGAIGFGVPFSKSYISGATSGARGLRSGGGADSSTCTLSAAAFSTRKAASWGLLVD
jgi:hypothetical protein